MPATLVCPACTRSLPVTQVPAQGTLVQCPLCQASFVLGRDAPLPLELAAPGPTPKSSVIPMAIAGAVIVGGLLVILLLVTLGGLGKDPAVPVSTATPPIPDTPPKDNPSKTAVAKPAPPVAPAAERATPKSKPAPAVAPPAPQQQPALAYKWERGMQYPYHFHIRPKGAGDDPSAEYGGMITYVASDEKTPLAGFFDTPPESREGTGTAFVVHSDGLLVTCEHVVRGAAKVEVTLDSQQHVAEVVASDRQRDLAILRIDARGLTALALGDSEQVQVAEAVRAAGYPLSDVLGNSLKITSGTVAGIVERGGRKQLQIDAPLNPGNSGGPVLNARGEVVGVCGSVLTGRALSNVGLAVPASEVLALLQQHDLIGNASAADDQLAGPDLVRRIAPAVGLVKVTLGIDHESVFGLSFTSFGHGTYGFSTPYPAPANGLVVVDKLGEVVSSRGDDPLPFHLGTYAALVLEKLPAGDELAWEERRVYVLASLDRVSSGAIDPFPGRYPFVPSPFVPRPQRLQATVVPVEERVSYERLQADGDLQRIRKRYKLSAAGEDDDSPLAVSGDGELKFDIKLGVPRELTMKFEVRESSGNVTVRLPVELSYTLGKIENHAQWHDRIRDEAKQKEEQELAERPVKLKQIIADLAGDELTSRRWSEIFTTLLRMEPDDEFRQPLSAALDKHLLSTKSTQLSHAYSILEKWGSESNVPTLLKALEATEPTYRYRVLENLGRYSRDPKVAQTIAGYLHSESEHYNAVRALKLMGPVAEEPVLKLLTPEASERMQNDICDVLGDVGTRKSVPTLQKLAAQEANPTLKYRAEAALRSIDRRTPDTGPQP